MLRFIFMLLCLGTVSAATLNGRAGHTAIYRDWKQGIFTQTLFLPNTYLGMTSDLDYICQDLGETRPTYLNILQQRRIGCSGSWCINGQFRCNYGKSQECYNVEHIVDSQNSIPELADYNKNILANVIMAYGCWNQQVGQLRWESVEAEKREIYGNALMDSAINAIIRCHEYNHAPPDPIENDDEDYDAEDTSGSDSINTENWIVPIALGAFIIIVPGILLCCVFKPRPIPVPTSVLEAAIDDDRLEIEAEIEDDRLEIEAAIEDGRLEIEDDRLAIEI